MRNSRTNARLTKLIGAWRQSKTQSEVKQAADAAARAHGEPVGILAMDWNSLMEKFRQTYSPDLCENELPAQSYFEEFEESLAQKDGSRQRGCGTWCRKKRHRNNANFKADPARQYGMHLDGKLTLQTRRQAPSAGEVPLQGSLSRTTFEDHLMLLRQPEKPFNSPVQGG